MCERTRARKSKIHNPWQTVLIHQHIFRLKVTMHQTCAVGCLQAAPGSDKLSYYHALTNPSAEMCNTL